MASTAKSLKKPEPSDNIPQAGGNRARTSLRAGRLGGRKAKGRGWETRGTWPLMQPGPRSRWETTDSIRFLTRKKKLVNPPKKQVSLDFHPRDGDKPPASGYVLTPRLQPWQWHGRAV